MRVLISGGGTGGHLFPAIAVAQALSRKDPDVSILFAGRRTGIEAKTVASYGMRFAAIPAAPLYTEELWRNWKLPPILGAALWQSWRLIDRFKPDAVFGTGGYVSVPLIAAAGLARIPIVLQEQNLMPGRATRVLARFATQVATAYPESSRFLRATTVVTGTPVRTEFWRRKETFPARPRSILVLGGSQGAHRVNQAVAEALPALLQRPDLTIVHQTGEREIESMRSVKAALTEPLAARYEPFGFASNLADRTRAADLVVSRAGASTLSEVSAIGIPMVLIPYPYAGGHQRLNAAPYEAAGAAIVIPDDQADGSRLLREVTSIDDPLRYRKMVEAMQGLGRPYAAEEVARLIESVARRPH
jgi:UDP-N-acetylglucosamine--N-acetylmuramyl-(pentapeptide) pyrophosphoryl-undecaprenol N-acetylglucosamine transferase